MDMVRMIGQTSHACLLVRLQNFVRVSMTSLITGKGVAIRRWARVGIGKCQGWLRTELIISIGLPFITLIVCTIFEVRVAPSRGIQRMREQAI
ncbi:hypothetical protein DSUL_20269 [Desulfovibrionales bacterium]